MITVPLASPVTTPVAETVALPLLAAHVPPLTASVNVIVDETNTEERPVMVPAEAEPPTLTVVVAVALPQLFDIV